MHSTLISAGGFFADSYDLYVIGVVLKIMAKVYPQTTFETSLVSTVALIGAIIGQLTGGFLADYVDRKKVFLSTLVVIIVGSLGSSILTGNIGIHDGQYSELAFWRGVLGLGIGMEYAIAPTFAHENKGNPVLVFAMQGFGYVCAGLCAYVLLLCDPDLTHLEFNWRFLLAFGSVPSLCVLYPRWKLLKLQQQRQLQTPLTSADHLLAMTRPNKCKTMYDALTTVQFGQRNYIWLIGTALTWCLFDISWYANSLFSSTIMNAMGLGSSLHDQALNALIVALMGLPGYWFSVCYFEAKCVARRGFGLSQLQLFGFLMCTALFLVLYASVDNLERYDQTMLIVIYGATFFFSNFGPNTTTFFAAVRIFPVTIRATSQGVSSAFGKLGAVMGTAFLKPTYEQYGLETVLLICAVIMFFGAITTIVFIPNVPHST